MTSDQQDKLADAWGQPISAERAEELDTQLRAWEAQWAVGHGTRRSPFDREAWREHLSGADVYYLAARTLAGGLAADAATLARAQARLRSEDTHFTLNLSGLHLAGAHLTGAHLEGADLIYAHLKEADLAEAHLKRALLGEAHLEGALLGGAHLEGALLTIAHLERAALAYAHLKRALLLGAHLEGVDLGGAHLEGATLDSAHLERANLTGAAFDKASRLNDAVLTGATFDQVSFDNTNLTVVDWSLVDVLGDERAARAAKDPNNGKPKAREQRLREYKAAVRANRILAVALEAQGLVEDANRFAYRAQHLQHHVLRLQHRWPALAGSSLLDLLAGYGYKPSRSFLAYAVLVGLFAALYWWLIAAGLTAEHLRSWADPLVLSITSFHGRAFFAGDLHLDDWVARVGAVEAAIGLLIEVIFIATFTQRFFSAK